MSEKELAIRLETESASMTRGDLASLLRQVVASLDSESGKPIEHDRKLVISPDDSRIEIELVSKAHLCKLNYSVIRNVLPGVMAKLAELGCRFCDEQQNPEEVGNVIISHPNIEGRVCVLWLTREFVDGQAKDSDVASLMFQVNECDVRGRARAVADFFIPGTVYNEESLLLFFSNRFLVESL